MSAPRTLAGQWAYFNNIAVPKPGLTLTQAKQREMMFYAGARAVIDVLQPGVSPGHMLAPANAAQMQAVYDEIIAWGRLVRVKESDARMADIVAQIAELYAPIFAAIEANAMSDEIHTSTMLAITAASSAGGWTEAEVDQALGQVVADYKARSGKA